VVVILGGSVPYPACKTVFSSKPCTDRNRVKNHRDDDLLERRPSRQKNKVDVRHGSCYARAETPSAYQYKRVTSKSFFLFIKIKNGKLVGQISTEELFTAYPQVVLSQSSKPSKSIGTCPVSIRCRCLLITLLRRSVCRILSAALRVFKFFSDALRNCFEHGSLE